MQLPDVAPVIAQLQAILETGSRWQQGGLDPRTGCGCYGLVWYAFALAGILLPDTAALGEQDFALTHPPYRPFDVAQANIGSMFVQPHVGILLTPSDGFHIAQGTNGVARFSLRDAFWRRRFRLAWRYRGFVCA